MAKIEYKDVPIYFAHADKVTDDTTGVDNIIDKSIASGSIKTAISTSESKTTQAYRAADENVKSWATQTFQSK